jgi:hypothetical protein
MKDRVMAPDRHRAGQPPQLGVVQRRVLLAAQVVAALIGLAAGFSFGNQISGVLMGVVVAPIFALFCSLFVGITVEQLLRALSRRHDAR